MSRQRRGVVVAAAGLALVLGAPGASAQTRFEWPDTAVHIAQYATVEQCLAAIERASGEVERRAELTVWRDTLPADPKAALAPAPTPVTETARRCAARYVEPTAPLDEFAPLLRLYLAAGRDADAASLVTRRLAAVSATRPREWAAVSDTAVDVYLKAKPVRLAAAEELLVERARGHADRLDRIGLYFRLMNAAQGVGDTARARRAARWVASTADSLTPAERESERFGELGQVGGRMVVFQAMQVVTGRSVMLDSLRHSTAAFAALERSLWARATGERPEAFPFPVGERAPAITADYWFPKATSDTTRPRPGRVSLISFFDYKRCFTNLGKGDVLVGACGGQLSKLRRLSERFPALDVTIVTETRGSFLYVPPPAPAEEAALVWTRLDTYRIPRVVLAVTTTPFWNLPRPDARRIDKDTPNLTRYSFGHGQGSGLARVFPFLIDQDGVVVSLTGDEDETAQLIEVLLHRQAGGTDRAAP